MYERVIVAVGSMAPNFTLKDENDREISLSTVRKGRKLVLAFVKGVDDAHTREQLDYFKDDYERFQFHDADVLVVTTGNVQFNRMIRDNHKLPFHILSDQRCDISRQYGIYNEYDKLLGPAIFVLNKAGVIVFMSVGKDPWDIVEDEEIIKVLEGDTQTAPGWPKK